MLYYYYCCVRRAKQKMSGSPEKSLLWPWSLAVLRALSLCLSLPLSLQPSSFLSVFAQSEPSLCRCVPRTSAWFLCCDEYLQAAGSLSPPLFSLFESLGRVVDRTQHSSQSSLVMWSCGRSIPGSKACLLACLCTGTHHTNTHTTGRFLQRLLMQSGMQQRRAQQQQEQQRWGAECGSV